MGMGVGSSLKLGWATMTPDFNYLSGSRRLMQRGLILRGFHKRRSTIPWLLLLVNGT